CGLSYVWARIHPPKDESNYENWLVKRFGWRLYRTFFKTYTEKVWGVPVSDMPADFAAQRVKNLDLRKAVMNAILPKRGQTDITTLIEEFQYPKYGPGMMWEVCTEKVRAGGGTVEMRAPLATIKVEGGRAVEVTYDQDGSEHTVPASHVISTMPMRELVNTITPPPPAEVVAAADDLHYRDYLTVALVVPQSRSFPDNWIYIHATDVEVGRIQNYGSWSPYLVKDGCTCLGLEYFVFEGDDMWNKPDEELIALGTKELISLGLAADGDVEQGYVVRVPKAYPYYDFSYKQNVETIRKWLGAEAPNIHPVGRNGMHKYNNQDHSMYTALLTVENIFGADYDVWTVNVEEEYHEAGSTGRDAPVLPRRAHTHTHTVAAGTLDPG
ncbi:MAG TPA: NAD(P)/FAD-dependent oxidoreductase, partial [Acidimicrobiales bacterium]|nr:NAD(P)/FAD-dependent oxidoreductase [Acidimicrobiales bacterium]